MFTKRCASRHRGLSVYPGATQLTGGWLLVLGLPTGLRVQNLEDNCCPPGWEETDSNMSYRVLVVVRKQGIWHTS